MFVFRSMSSLLVSSKDSVLLGIRDLSENGIKIAYQFSAAKAVVEYIP